MANPLARRTLVAALALGAVWLAGAAQAQDKLKVAAVYTVPVEQQWVSRIHQALKAASCAARSPTTGRRTSPTPTTSG